MNRNITIRMEAFAEVPAVRRVNELAFGRPQEADLADRLRAGCRGLISLVAIADDQLVGHALFNPAVMERSHGSLSWMGRAPIAVLP